MPIYEYECLSCGHRMEAIQQLGDPGPTDCPACAKTDLRRLVSAAGFRLKGSGWYATDFKDQGKGKDQDQGKGKGKDQDKDQGKDKDKDKDKDKGKTEQSDGGTKKPADGGTPAAETRKPEQPSTASE